MIFCVEDDNSIREIEIYTLQTMGFEVRGFDNGNDFLQAIEKELPDLVLLDVMLPGIDGIEILKILRDNPRTRNLAVIMATARDAEIEKIQALNQGADDYLSKPFSMLEMVARVKAVLRRTHTAPAEDKNAILRFGPLTIDNLGHTVLVEDTRVELTLKEYDVLNLLCRNPGRVFSRDELLNNVWGVDYDGESRTVDMHIKTLRQKLGPVAGPMIKTVRGIGYKIEDL